MLTKFTQRQYGLSAAFCGMASVVLFSFMTHVTLAHIQIISGLAPFDMRPFGYNPEDAAQLLAALGDTGRAYYLTQQIPLDTIYPAVLALTLTSANFWFGACLQNRKIIWVGTVFAVTAAVADYVENLGITLMIRNWPDVPSSLVHTSSVASNIKAFGTTIAAVITILLIANWALKKLHTRRQTGQNLTLDNTL